MIVRSEAEMIELASATADRLRPGQLVTLSGPLGAGKTVFARAVLARLGFAGEVASPTYAIIHDYDDPAMRMAVVHADLYRLESPDELEELGLFDDPDRLVLVEWPDKGGSALDRADVAIAIAPLDDASRDVAIIFKRT